MCVCVWGGGGGGVCMCICFNVYYYICRFEAQLQEWMHPTTVSISSSNETTSDDDAVDNSLSLHEKLEQLQAGIRTAK